MTNCRATQNLRGWQAIVEFDGQPRLVTIITRIRDDIWLVDGRALPKRFERYRGCRRTTVRESQLTLVAEREAAENEAFKR